jgi:transcriptional regulator with XRE-family HTH domain
LDWSQEQMAAKMNKTQSAYARIERGVTKIDLETLFKFAKVTNRSVIDVITYPEVFVNRNEFIKENDFKTIIQIEVRDNKKIEVLKTILGKEGFDKLNIKK